MQASLVVALPQNICQDIGEMASRAKLSLFWKKKGLLGYMFNMHTRCHFTELKLWTAYQ